MDVLFPAGLALGALAAPLIALYFLRIRRRRIRVSSLLPWHAVQQSERAASPFHRFRKHLLLFLQLLLLLLMTFALARPAIQTETKGVRSVVLVVDTSASMGATDESPHRVAAATRQAQATLDSLGVGDEAMLIEAGPRTSVRVPFTHDKGAVSSELAALQPSQAQGTLHVGLQLALSLARARPNVEVLVFSDGGGDNLEQLSAGDTPVRYVPIGLRSNNSGITALDLRRSPTNDLDRQLFVTVQNFGARSVESSVEVYAQGELLALRNAKLPAAEPVSMVFDIPGSARGTLEVRLEAPDDLLDADNRAFAILTAAASRKVLLVGDDPFTASILGADPRVSLLQRSADQVTPSLLDQVDCALFADAVPDDVHGLPHAILGPLAGSPVQYADNQPAPQVLDWQRTHPAMRSVQWDQVTVGSARSVSDNGGLIPIVQGDTGPLVLAGERNGGRVLALSFDPYQTDLPMRVAWPILILNTVGWLTEGAPEASEARLLRTGSTWVRRIADDTVPQARITGPNAAFTAPISEGTLRIQNTFDVGIYAVHAGSLRTTFAANLLSKKESDIHPRPSLSMGDGETTVSQAALASSRMELWRPLLFGALFLMMLEWFAWNRRRAA